MSEHCNSHGRRPFVLKSVAAICASGAVGNIAAKPVEIALVPYKEPPGPSAVYFPNMVVSAHTGEKFILYDDLIRGKIILLNFIEIRSKRSRIITRKLVELQHELSDRIGNDIFMYTLTLDPTHDTPLKLGDFAKDHGIDDSWLFINAGVQGTSLLRERLSAIIGIVRYGNEALGRWGSFIGETSVASMVDRFSWIGFQKGSSG